MSEYSNRKPLYENVLGKESAFHNPYTFIPFPPENSPPRRSVSTPLTADEEKDWFFHCHVLYHMMAGMMTKVVVARMSADAH